MTEPSGKIWSLAYQQTVANPEKDSFQSHEVLQGEGCGRLMSRQQSIESAAGASKGPAPSSTYSKLPTAPPSGHAIGARYVMLQLSKGADSLRDAL
ncbi:hypothetical protein L7F22_004402 [Adiantum nelumboides]|nr:hypothetical protein [Adiantum nelumboides]